MSNDPKEEEMLTLVADIITRIAKRRSVTMSQVDDFVQEGLLGASKAYRRYGHLHNRECLRKLMVTSANNQMFDWQRKIIRFSRVSGVENIPDAHYETDFLLDSSITELVDLSLQDVSERIRPMVRMWIASEATANNEEIAKKLGISRSAVSRAMSDWKDKIRTMIEDD